MGGIFGFVLLLPLFSFLTMCMFGHKIGTYGSMLLGVINILAAFGLSLGLFICTGFNAVLSVSLYDWLDVVGFNVAFCFQYYSLTSIMFLVVTAISSCVHVYSCIYMYTDIYLSRFISYLSLFTFFMLVLVSASNLLILFLGW